MKYIRTEDGRILDFDKLNEVSKLSIDMAEEPITEADTIEELCDGYFADDGSIETYNVSEFNRFQDYILDTGFDGYGFIKTSKGLIYVAKMNDKGDWELI